MVSMTFVCYVLPLFSQPWTQDDHCALACMVSLDVVNQHACAIKLSVMNFFITDLAEAYAY
jgi:hypothetical protein